MANPNLDTRCQFWIYRLYRVFHLYRYAPPFNQYLCDCRCYYLPPLSSIFERRLDWTHFADAVMVGEAAAVGDNLISRSLFDFFVSLNRIFDAPIFEGEIEIHTGTCEGMDGGRMRDRLGC